MTGRSCEVIWFSALCDDDYEFLGVPDQGLAKLNDYHDMGIRAFILSGYP